MEPRVEMPVSEHHREQLADGDVVGDARGDTHIGPAMGYDGRRVSDLGLVTDRRHDVRLPYALPGCFIECPEPAVAAVGSWIGRAEDHRSMAGNGIDNRGTGGDSGTRGITRSHRR